MIIIGLINKIYNEILIHSVEGNPKLLCTKGPCGNKPGEGGHPKKSIIVPVVSSVALIAILIAALVLFLVLRKKNPSRSKGIYGERISSYNYYTLVETIQNL